MEVTLRIQVIHVNGTRMISKDSDGFSKGLMTEGVMSVEYMLLFVPLHLSALQRSYNLLECIKNWWGQGNEVLPMT